jgi:hypothetical protein
MMTLSAGAALALYGILSESPQAGRFWGWLGGAFGCFFGGSGVLFGAIIRYLHLDGSRDPVTSRSPNGLNRVLGGGALLGGIAIVTALAWSSTGLAVRCSMLLLGTMLIGQSGLFWMLHRRHPRSLQSGGCGKDFPAVPSPPSGPSEGERSLPGACRAATCPTGPATRREE